MRIFCIIIFFTLASGLNAQHSSVYSQYFFNGFLVNPGYAGSQNALSASAIYRNQWTGLKGAPQTLSFTAHMPLRSKKVNLGIILSNDKFGVNNNASADMVYAYRIFFKKSALSFGLQGGINMQRINWSLIETNETTDPVFSGGVQTSYVPQAGFGIYHYSQIHFLGVSAYSQFNNGFTRYSPLMLTGGVVINSKGTFKVKPAVLVKYMMNSPVEIDGSLTFYWGDYIGIGAGYRSSNAGVGFIDLRFNDQLRIGYSYDYTLSTLKNYSSGSHEVMIRYLFMYKVDGKSPRYF